MGILNEGGFFDGRLFGDFDDGFGGRIAEDLGGLGMGRCGFWR